MKLLFIHSSEKVKRDNEGILYTDGSYSQEVWDNYFKVFHEITIIMREDTKEYTREDASSKFNSIPSVIKFIPITDSNRSIVSYLSSKERNEQDRVIENEIKKADAVIVRMPGTPQALQLAQKNQKKCLVEVVGDPFDSLWNHSWKGKILAVPAYLKMRKALLNATNSIYVTDEYLQNKYPTNGDSIGCSDVKIEPHNNKTLQNRISKIQETNGKLVIGTAAGIGVKYKGQQFVIRALGQLKKAGIREFEYRIAGNGNTDYLQSEIEKNDVTDCVSFVGNIPHEKMGDWYKQLDIYIQPSLQEGLPRALIEAMSCAVPCIGSNVGGIPELLDKNALFKKGSVEQIKVSLLNMRNKDFRKIQAERCFLKSKDYDKDFLDRKRIDYMKRIFEVK